MQILTLKPIYFISLLTTTRLGGANTANDIWEPRGMKYSDDRFLHSVAEQFVERRICNKIKCQTPPK